MQNRLLGLKKREKYIQFLEFFEHLLINNFIDFALINVQLNTTSGFRVIFEVVGGFFVAAIK